jgi:hypothetical protein
MIKFYDMNCNKYFIEDCYHWDNFMKLILVGIIMRFLVVDEF